MLIFLEHRLAYLATPKTGTTAVEAALRRHADIVFARGRKHMTARRFHRRVVPFLEKTFGARPESVAVMRDPVEQLRSWFRYRSGQRQQGTDKGTAGMSFDAFVKDVLSATPPPHAAIGSQFGFLTSREGNVLVDHLFDWDNRPGFHAFLSDRLGVPLDIKAQNVSPEAAAPLSPEAEEQLRVVRAEEFALYDSLRQAGGYLRRTG